MAFFKKRIFSSAHLQYDQLSGADTICWNHILTGMLY